MVNPWHQKWQELVALIESNFSRRHNNCYSPSQQQLGKPQKSDLQISTNETFAHIAGVSIM
jgi:hypothetical protein